MTISFVLLLFATFLLGCTFALVGLLKDTRPYKIADGTFVKFETIRLTSFLRTPTVVMLFGAALYVSNPQMIAGANVAVIAFCALALERISHEIWKGLDGRRIASRASDRLTLLGVVTPLIVFATLMPVMVVMANTSFDLASDWTTLRLFGMAFGFGLIVAAFGAFKDTLWESFRLRTFFRSPALITMFFFVLVWMEQGVLHTHTPLTYFPLAAAGVERVGIEAWKLLIGRRPAKFESDCRDRNWIRRRIVGLLTRRRQALAIASTTTTD